MGIYTDLDQKYSFLNLGYDKTITKTLSDFGNFGTTPELINTFSSGTAPKSLIAGEFISSIEQQAGVFFSNKTSFTDTTAGYRWGVDSSDGLFKFVIGTTGQQVDWNVTTANTLTINGSITATSGTFGSWTISGNTFTTVANNILIGTGAGAAITSGTSNIFIGYQAGNAALTTSTSVFIGYQAGLICTAGQDTFIGYQSGFLTINFSRSTFIGYQAGYNSTSADNIAIGNIADIGTGYSACIVIGNNVKTTASNQMLLGGANVNGIQDVYIGTGVTDAGAGGWPVTIQPSGQTGTNTVAGSLTLAGGKATGSAVGGSLLFKTSVVGASGTTLQSLATRLTIDNLANIVPGTAALATTATDGFIYIQTCAGIPTGVPTTFTGRIAMIYDTTNNNFYVYNGAWKKVALA